MSLEPLNNHKIPSGMGGGKKSGPLSDWMGNLPAKLHTEPLNTLAIPGSHDSFTYFLDKNGPISPSESKELVELAKIFGPMVKDIAFNWSVTQKYSVKEQLDAGVRYFDIRIAVKDLGSKNNHEDLFIVHGLYGFQIYSILNEINSFMVEHPKEIVLLDFNHFYDMTPHYHNVLMEKIQEVFGERMCPFLGTESLCLSTLWESNLQVVVFYQSENGEDNSMFWPSSSIKSPWPNVTDLTKLLHDLERDYDQGRPADKFYVTQGILSPDTPFIVSHLGGSLEKDMADKAAQSVVNWLNQKHCGLDKGINICIMDFVHLAEYIQTIVNLNYKTKEESS